MNLTKLSELSALSEKARQSFEIARGKDDLSFERAASFSDEMTFRQELAFWYRANESALMEMERNDRRYRNWKRILWQVARTSEIRFADFEAFSADYDGEVDRATVKLDAALDAGGKEGA